MAIYQRIEQNLGIKARLEKILDAIIEAIVNIDDFVLIKHISLSEIALFVIAFGRALWFVAFGVKNANYDYYFSEGFWTVIFLSLSATHLTGFFLKSLRVRIIALYGYAFVWCFLAILAGLSGTYAPALPTLVVFTLFSLILIVRLSREEKENAK